MVSVSIIIVTYNRIEMLKSLLTSIVSSKKNLQIIVVNNSLKKIELTEFKTILINKVHDTPGEARNTGIQHATNDWILFLDDDVVLPKEYLKRTINYISANENKIDMIGGPDQTPPNSGLFQESLGLCLKSPMTTAKTRFRHINNHLEIKSGDEKNLILCNLWVRRNFLTLNKICFNKNFFRNEENILITEALKFGARAFYKSDFFVYHFRKTNIFSLSKSTFSSGRFRAKSFFYKSELFHPSFLIPSLWVMYLISIILVTGLNDFYYIPLYAYLILTIIFSLKTAKGRPHKAVIIATYQILINIIYGLGVIFGLILK